MTLFLSCRPSEIKNNFIPDEFSYPLDSILDGRVFIYEDTEKNQRVVSNLEIKNFEGVKYLIEKKYVGSKLIDSNIKLNGNLVEV